MKKSYLNAIEKIRKLGFTEPSENQNQMRSNPYTGANLELCPLACMIYDFVTTKTLVCGQDFTRQTWDNARYCFATEWPDEYYALLD